MGLAIAIPVSLAISKARGSPAFGIVSSDYFMLAGIAVLFPLDAVKLKRTVQAACPPGFLILASCVLSVAGHAKLDS